MSDSETSENLADTSKRLRDALRGSDRVEYSKETGDDDGLGVLPTDTVGGRTADDTDRAEEKRSGEDSADIESSGISDLTGQAESVLEGIVGGEDGESDEGSTTEDRISGINDLLRVIDEAKDLLSTIDLPALLEAIDVSKLPQAIEMSEVPTAIRERDPKKAIRYRKLLNVIDFRTLLGSADILELRSEKGEFEDAFEDLTGRTFGGDDKKQEDGGLGSEIMDDLGGGMGAMSAIAGEDEAIPSDLMQDQIQSKLDEATEGLRESAFDARASMKEMRETTKAEVEAKTGGTAGRPNSDNPTAYSTLPPFDKRADMGGVAQFSTIPRTAWHSTASGRDRVYGDRFERKEQEREAEQREQREREQEEQRRERGNEKGEQRDQ